MLHVSKCEMKVGVDRNTSGKVVLNMSNSVKKSQWCKFYQTL